MSFLRHRLLRMMFLIAAFFLSKANMLFYSFKIDKAIQAAGVLLSSARARQMSYLRLLKLLYMADRESLARVGRPIIGAHPVAMDYGPLHSEVLDLIKGETARGGEWSKYIRTFGYEVELVADPDRTALSQQEIEILNHVAANCREFNEWELVEQTHEFPEWKKRHIVGSSQLISIEDILDALGWTSADKECVLDELRDELKIEQMLPSSCRSVPM